MRVLCNTVMRLVLCVVLFAARAAHGCRGGTLLKTGVTQQERVDILESHNRLRQSVAQGQVHGQPGAQNMMEMQWDEELAVKAQQWANECYFEHDESRYLGRFIMGQNLAIMWSTEPLGEHEGDFPSRIQNWFNEVRQYSFGGAYTSKTGHYSQLIWGESNLVGCGFSYYYDGYKYSKLWVCNYGPGGNVVGEDPYATGRPSCQNHGLSTSSRWPGLCTSAPDSYAPAQNVNHQYDNVIPDTGFNYQAAYDASVNKYKQYEAAKQNYAPAPKPQQPTYVAPQQPAYVAPQQPAYVAPQQPAYAAPKPFGTTKHNDYTFSSFGFNTNSAAAVVAPKPAVEPFKFATTPKPQQSLKQHSAFFTYDWNSLFNNYYSYNNVR